MFFLMGAASPPNPPPGISSPGPLNEALGLGEWAVCRSACSGLVMQEVAAYWIAWRGEETGWVLMIAQLTRHLSRNQWGKDRVWGYSPLQLLNLSRWRGNVRKEG